MTIDYSGLISEGGRAALNSLKNLPPDQRKAKMNDMLANGLLPFSVALAVDKQLTEPMKENAPSPRPGSVMSEKIAMLQNSGRGINQLPAPSMDQAQFAGGGIIAFDDGGTTDKIDPFSGMAASQPTHKRHGIWQFAKSLYGDEPPTLEEFQRKGQAERDAAGVGNAATKYKGILDARQKEYDTSSEEDRRDARKAGWLAMAQAGMEGKGLLEGGARGLMKNAEVMEAKKKERKAELRELQKQQYELELGMEQARMAGSKQDYDRYAAALKDNYDRQKMVSGLVESMAEMESREQVAASDRSTRPYDITQDYMPEIRALEKRISEIQPYPGYPVDPTRKDELDGLTARRLRLIRQYNAAINAGNKAILPAQIRSASAEGIQGIKSNQTAIDLVNMEISALERKFARNEGTREDLNTLQALRDKLKELKGEQSTTGGSPQYAPSAVSTPQAPAELDPSLRQ